MRLRHAARTGSDHSLSRLRQTWVTGELTLIIGATGELTLIIGATGELTLMIGVTGELTLMIGSTGELTDDWFYG